MTDIDVDALGPVDYLVVEFPAGEQKLTGEGLEELRKLAESGTIRILDLIILARGEDGSVDALELQDADESDIGALRDLIGELAVLLAEEDVQEIGATLSPGAARWCWSSRTPGQRRSAPPCAGRAASWWRTGGFRPRPSWRPSRPRRAPTGQGPECRRAVPGTTRAKDDPTATTTTPAGPAVVFG